MRLVIDSIDFSEYLTKYGYTVTQKKVLGGNSIVTLDGTSHEDILAWKDVVMVEMKPLTPSQLATLVAACKKETVTATYFDTETNAYVSQVMKPTLSQAKIALNKTSAVYWSGGGSGIQLTLEEK